MNTQFQKMLSPRELELNNAGKCICCEGEARPIIEHHLVACYDDGGSLDSFDVIEDHVGYEALCDGCEMHVPDEILDRIYGYEPEQVLPQDTYNGDLMGDEGLPF